METELMINQLTIMLYVKDVEETAKFWERYLDFNRQQEIEVGPSTSIILSNDKNFAIQLFDVEFIKQVSPEISLETPSLMLHVDDLEAVHKKLKTGNTFVNDIASHGGNLSFNFADNEGRYFACSQA